ncbi:MAG: class I SAM-dependent methyltransferase [Chloroflexi bacterium]|nr:class I SAM-dependent methyltransferase [Chloroflexota bacterium]
MPNMTDPFPATPVSKLWNERAAASSDQIRRALENSQIDDSWNQMTARFAPTAEGEPEDPVITLIRPWLEPNDTVIDVGCGAGRLAVPLAGICDSIIGLDPSPSMLADLAKQVSDRQITNVQVDESTWEEWPEEAADVVLISHLLYVVHPIEEFLEKAHRVAGRRIIVMLSTAQPIAYFHPLWEAAHGEPCIASAGADEFRALLESWGIAADIEAMDSVMPRPFPDASTALKRAAGRLHVKEGTPAFERLSDAVDESLVATGNGKFRFRWEFQSTPYVFSWRTDT